MVPVFHPRMMLGYHRLMQRRVTFGALGILLVTVLGCDLRPANKVEPAAKAVVAPPAEKNAQATVKPANQQAPRGPVFVSAPAEGDVAELVKAELARADGDIMMVYVSAEWCEPCRYFERAVGSGELREEFPNLRLFKFNYDRDEGRLAQAGYISDMIPLFAIPGKDGRAGDLRMEGSVKGADAVAGNITPRLRELLGANTRQ